MYLLEHHSIATAKLKERNLLSLKGRREQGRLALFRDIVKNNSALKLPSYIMKTTRNTRQSNSNFSSFVHMQCRTESYRNSLLQERSGTPSNYIKVLLINNRRIYPRDL